MKRIEETEPNLGIKKEVLLAEEIAREATKLPEDKIEISINTRIEQTKAKIEELKQSEIIELAKIATINKAMGYGWEARLPFTMNKIEHENYKKTTEIKLEHLKIYKARLEHERLLYIY